MSQALQYVTYIHQFYPQNNYNFPFIQKKTEVQES